MNEFEEVTNLIVDKTKEGPVSQWVDRIGELARKAGLPLDIICWQGAPVIVACDVYQQAKAYGKIDKLIAVCKD